MSLLDRLFGRQSDDTPNEPPESGIWYTPDERELRFTVTMTEIEQDQAKEFAEALDGFDVDEVDIVGTDAEDEPAVIRLRTEVESLRYPAGLPPANEPDDWRETDEEGL